MSSRREAESNRLRNQRRELQASIGVKMQRRFGDPDLDADVKFGDIVTIRIPPNLRGPVDEPFIVCVVVEKFDPDFVRLCTAR